LFKFYAEKSSVPSSDKHASIRKLTLPDDAPLVADESESGFVRCTFCEDYVTLAIRCNIQSHIQTRQYSWQRAELDLGGMWVKLWIKLWIKLCEPII
jgi:hypothetical protein